MPAPMIHGVEELAQLFSIFHDGVVTQPQASGDNLLLRVEISYLAERIQPGFTVFQVCLHRVEDLSFVTWPKDAAAAPQILHDIEDIFNPELDILSGDIAEDRVHVVCNQASPSTPHCGGTLTFRAASAAVTDEKGTPYSLADLAIISRAYWDEWSARKGHP